MKKKVPELPYEIDGIGEIIETINKLIRYLRALEQAEDNREEEDNQNQD